MPFQTTVNAVPAPGIAGDFASTNLRHSVLGGPAGLVAGSCGSSPNGLTCGRFAWLDTATYSVVSNAGAGAPSGFVRNAHNALITAYLGETSLVIPTGFPTGNLFDGGDFWALNSTGAAVTPGLKVYVNNTTGAISSFALTGTPSTAGTSTASTIAANTTVAAVSVTGSIAIPVAGATTGNAIAPAILTVSAVATGTLYPGIPIAGANVTSGTTIIAQLTGTTGGVGTYSVSIAQTAASATVTATYGILTVGGTVVAGYAVGQSLSAGSAGTVITALGTGTGGAGTYIVNNTQTVASTTINSYIGTETAWYAASMGTGATGEVIKITSKWP